MKHEDDIFRAEVAAALEGDAAAGEHPSLDRLEAYRRDRLPGAEAEETRDHLATCRACFDRLAELEAFVEAGATGPPELRRLDEAAAWRALRAELRAELPRPGSPEAGPGRAEGRRLNRMPRALVAWAAILVVGLGVGFWIAQQHREVGELRREVARLSRPQPSVALVELFPDSTVRGPGGETGDDPDGASERVALDEIDHLTLVLHLPEPPAASRLEAKIVDAEGDEVWTGHVQTDAYGTVTLGLPPSSLPAGSYRIDLYVPGADEREPVESFRFELV